MVVAAALLISVLGGASPAGAQSGSFASDTAAECQPLVHELAEAIRQWTRGAKHADWNEVGFRSALTGPKRTRDEIAAIGVTPGLLGVYLFANEGKVPPLRTGRELAFFTQLKQRILTSSPTDRMGLRDLLMMGLDATADAWDTPTSRSRRSSPSTTSCGPSPGRAHGKDIGAPWTPTIR